MYEGYNSLARQLLGLKGQKLQDDRYSSEMARLDAFAKAYQDSRKKTGGGGGMSAMDAQAKGEAMDQASDKASAEWASKNNGTMSMKGSNTLQNTYEDDKEINKNQNEARGSGGGSSGGSSSGWEDGSSSGTADNSSGYESVGDYPTSDSSYAAKGGPVKAGKKYIVGEGGKDEVYVQGDGDVYPLTEQQGIIPKEDGTIIPNPKLRKLARVMLNNKG